jgi:uncharacterized protein
VQPTAFQPQFQIAVRDLERADQRRRFDVSPEWINWALQESDARSDGSTGVLEVYLKKSGPEVLVKGEVQASVTMPCARTLEPVPVTLDADIYLLLSPRRTAKPASGKATPGTKAAPGKGTPNNKAAPGDKTASLKTAGGAAREARPRETRGDTAEALEELLSADLAARDEYEGDAVVLDAFVREHLLLELPLFPVKSDLPFAEAPATDTPPDESGAPVDPRLAPLAALASQLQLTGKIAKSDKE